jgi:hypothetical protein
MTHCVVVIAVNPLYSILFRKLTRVILANLLHFSFILHANPRNTGGEGGGKVSGLKTFSNLEPISKGF